MSQEQNEKDIIMNWEVVFKLKAFAESEIHPHSPFERAEQFKSFEGGSVECEVMDFLYAVVRLFKPEMILETGTHFGFSAAALALACKENGFGKVYSIETEESKIAHAKKLSETASVTDHVEYILGNSLDIIPKFRGKIKGFGFVFLDSLTPIRPKEFELLYANGLIMDLVAFHDTSRFREQSLKNDNEPQGPYCDSMDKIEKLYCRGGIENNLSRGFRLLQVKKT